jgi:23S rRNA (uracil1939-C5)-methyltransferase
VLSSDAMKDPGPAPPDTPSPADPARPAGGSNFRKGDVFVTPVERLAFGGAGIGHAPDGRIAFVEGGLPGDSVRAFYTKIKKDFVEARVEEVLSPSPDRREPRCRHAGTCGGCRLQELDYPAQVAAKGRHVTEALEHIGRAEDFRTRPPIASESEWFYRNKMEFTFGAAEDGSLTLGLHRRGRFDRIVDLAECPLVDERVGSLLDAVREWARTPRAAGPGGGLAPYDPRRAEGLLRYLVLRMARSTGQVMVDLVTTSMEPPDPETFVAAVRSVMPEATVIHTTHRGRATAYVVEAQTVLAGPGLIEEEMAGRRFLISPSSFFQTNTRMAERLCALAGEAASLTDHDRLLDLYCGTGAIGLALAGRVREVVGIESNPSAIEDARRNAEINRVGNATFVAASVEKGLPEALESLGPFDAAVLDPPRAGLHPKALAALAASGIDRLAYVSCNPATLARDVQALAVSGFDLEWVQPIDMFPQTPHVEAVAALSRLRHLEH